MRKLALLSFLCLSSLFAQNDIYVRFGDAKSNTQIVTNGAAFARADITNSVIYKTDIVVDTNNLENVSYNIRGTEYSIQPAGDYFPNAPWRNSPDEGLVWDADLYLLSLDGGFKGPSFIVNNDGSLLFLYDDGYQTGEESISFDSSIPGIKSSTSFCVPELKFLTSFDTYVGLSTEDENWPGLILRPEAGLWMGSEYLVADFGIYFGASANYMALDTYDTGSGTAVMFEFGTAHYDKYLDYGITEANEIAIMQDIYNATNSIGGIDIEIYDSGYTTDVHATKLANGPTMSFFENPDHVGMVVLDINSSEVFNLIAPMALNMGTVLSVDQYDDPLPNVVIKQKSDGSYSIIQTDEDPPVERHLLDRKALQGKTFDFSTMAGLYIAVSNVVTTLGGSITNFPSLQ